LPQIQSVAVNDRRARANQGAQNKPSIPTTPP
jgi:hypothetical protein